MNEDLVLDLAAIAVLTALAAVYDGELVYIAAGWAGGRLAGRRVGKTAQP